MMPYNYNIHSLNVELTLILRIEFFRQSKLILQYPYQNRKIEFSQKEIVW